MKLRYAFIALIFFAPLIRASTHVPLQARETMLSQIRATLTNDGAFGYGFDRNRRGGVWPRKSSAGYLTVGGLWFACGKRVGDSLVDVCMIGVDPKTGKRGFTPGNISDNTTASDTALLERAQVFSSAFVESNNFDPLTTHVWPVRSVNGARTVVRSAASRDSFPRYEISDEDLFALFSDADASRIINAGAGLPLGIDVEQTAYTWFDDTLRDAVILEWRITNRSHDTLIAPTAAAVFALAVGDTAAGEAGYATRVDTTTVHQAGVVCAHDINNISLGWISIIGIDSGSLTHAWPIDSAPPTATLQRNILSSPSSINSTIISPVAAVSRNGADLLPGDTMTFRCALAIAVTAQSLQAIINRISRASQNDFSNQIIPRSTALNILDAEVSDSNTTFVIPSANIHVEQTPGTLWFDVLTDQNGSARVRVPNNQNISVTASSNGYANVEQDIMLNNAAKIVPFALPEFSAQTLLPSTPSYQRLGDLLASARIDVPERAVKRSNHLLQVVTDGLIGDNAQNNSATKIPFHIYDATSHEILLRDTLATTLQPCGNFPDTISSQRTVVIDSAISITVMMHGVQQTDPVAVSRFSFNGSGTNANAVLQAIGPDDTTANFSCAYAHAGSETYSMTFENGGSAQMSIGKYLVTAPLLRPHLFQYNLLEVPHGNQSDTGNAAFWTMRVGAWRKHAGTFIGYPYIDGDTSQCEFFENYFLAVSLFPYENDTIVFTHCLTVNGNRFGIDYANKGLPSMPNWKTNSFVPTKDIDTSTTLTLAFAGGISANFPADSAIVSFQMPVISGVAEHAVLMPSIEMYPVPATKNISLNVSGEEHARIEIRDMFGRVLISTFATGGKTQSINIERLSSGMYEIIVRLSQTIVRKELIIVK